MVGSTTSPETLPPTQVRWTSTVRRSGDDVTLITYGGTLPKTLEAAEQLAADRIAADVIDLRTLRPLDMATVNASVARTHRAVVVDEGWRSGSLSAEISADSPKRCSMTWMLQCF